MAFLAYSNSAYPLKIRKEMDRFFSRILSISSRPNILGIFISTIIRSGISLSYFSKASLPLAAICTTSKPYDSQSISAFNACRIIGSSSTVIPLNILIPPHYVLKRIPQFRFLTHFLYVNHFFLHIKAEVFDAHSLGQSCFLPLHLVRLTIA